MSILSLDKDTPVAPGKPCPLEVQAAVKRGRSRAQALAPKRNECMAFWRGEQWCYIDSEGTLQWTPTAPGAASATSKPKHRVRTTRNQILPLVRQEVSYATQRVPSYQVVPSNADQPTQEAARVAEKVALYGYDAWRVRPATVRVVTDAIVADEGYAWPFWDSTIGVPVTDTGEGEGDIKIRTFGPNEVYWEPGVRFEDSRWHAVEQAKPMAEIRDLPGYLGGELAPDAQASNLLNKGQAPSDSRLVLVTDYLERPCPRYPQGRWLTLAQSRQITEAQPYPLQDEKGEPLDEPVLHKLSVIVDPQSDRDMGIVRHCLDPQRTYNGVVSRSLEWVALALNPQRILQNVTLGPNQRFTDEPGATYKLFGSGEIKWQQVPPIPQELFQVADKALSDMQATFSQNSVSQQTDTARGIQALLDEDNNARADFLANLAEFHSRLMRHCLYLVAQHYTEERTLYINGEFGSEDIPSFLGEHLRCQANVRVLPESLEPRTREFVQQQVMNFAQLGWITPEAAMSAIRNGTAEGLVESYEKDVARAWRVIKQIKAGPHVLFGGQEPQPQYDPNNSATTTPQWMPRPWDNVDVHKQVFSSWMKTIDYENLEPGLQQAAQAYYEALDQMEADQQQKAQMAQAMTAQQMGQTNAAQPPSPSPTPSLPALAGSSNGSSDGGGSQTAPPAGQ